MDQTETDNTLSGPHSPGTDDKPVKGRGDFSLKPAGRRGAINKKIFIIIAVAFLAFLLLGGLFIYAVIASASKADDQVKVDESKVKTSPLLQGQNKKDDSMQEQMDKLLASKVPPKTETPKPPETPPDKAAQISDNHAAASTGNERNSDTASNQNQNPYQQPRHEESTFGTVNRFDSSGMSAGSVGMSTRVANGSSGFAAGSNEEQLRQFINANPAELAAKMAASSGGGSGGGELGGGGSGQSSLLDNLSNTQYEQTKAYLSPPTKFLLKKRTTFQCVLDVGVKTDYPGFVECHLFQPLYSADGSVILARAGAKLFGEQKVILKPGQTSVFTSWGEMETALGRPGEPLVRANLQALGTDAMGRSGTDAEIDNHWGQRVGGAVMLSTFKDVLNGGVNAINKGGNSQFTFNNTENASEDLASKMLDSTIGIPPTGFIKPGTVINVVVAQDIDFSSVLKTRR